MVEYCNTVMHSNANGGVPRELVLASASTNVYTGYPMQYT